jgi:hypothetical protein
MFRKPTNHSRPRTSAEITELMRLVSEGVSFRGIAKELGRTTASVEHKAGVEKRAGQVPPGPSDPSSLS